MIPYHRYTCMDDCSAEADGLPCIAESIVGPPESCFFNNCKVEWLEVLR